MKKQIISAVCAVGMLATVSSGFTTVSAETPTSYIFTNNLTSDFDKSLYTGMEAKNIGLTYTYESDDTAFETKDSTHEILTKGYIYATSGAHAVTGTYTTSANSVDVIAYTKTNTCITGADLYRLEEDGKLGSVSVSVSSDGVTYSDPVTATITGPIQKDGNDVATGTRKLYKYAVDFSTPVTGRYIKITSSGTQQQVLSEIVVRGYIPDNSKVLTNNLTSDFDKSLYTGKTAMNIGLNYTYESDDTAFETKDSNHEMLTKGYIYATSGAHAVTGTYTTSANSVAVIADTKTNTCITGADLYRLEEDGKLGSVSVSVSSDGVTYSDPVTATITGPIQKDGNDVATGTRKLYRYAVDFSIPVTGRYVKITSSGTQQQVLSEIVVKGSPAEFSFGGTKFDSATSKFSGFLVNEPDVAAVESKVITAVYDADGRFVAAKTANVAVDANSSQSFSADFNGVTIENGYKIKSYAWNSDNKYLTSPAEYTYTVQ